ncbi:colicin immunity protein [Photorhabdus sp. P32]|uniref:colicin immunity protein n=1 Tax=Photorhabdus sp. P32 TaxID=3117549 RepID=UPI00311AD135
MSISIDQLRVYTNPDEFFALGGSVGMKLTPQAAIGVCEIATNKNLVISRIEGFIWHRNTGKFEARLDAIWDGLVNPGNDLEKVEKNNKEAIENIKEDEKNGHNVFIITIAKKR